MVQSEGLSQRKSQRHRRESNTRPSGSLSNALPRNLFRLREFSTDFPELMHYLRILGAGRVK